MTSDAPSQARPTQAAAEPAAPVRRPVELTGVPAVDAALGRLEALAEVPLIGHAAVYEQVHADLRSALDAPGDGERPVPGTRG